MTVSERMLLVLSDGEPHTREELYKCLHDDLANVEAVAVGVCRLRQALADGLHVLYKDRAYRLVRVLHLKTVD